ncbi:MAG: hypothetical protein M1G31_01250 [Pseudanabaena sp. Salubria-1]|nr:hypothetical protein [Pseudanabaena sp. Salubria-1]
MRLQLDKYGYLRDGIYSIANFASEIGIAAGIVVGRLHHDNNLRRKIDLFDF